MLRPPARPEVRGHRGRDGLGPSRSQGRRQLHAALAQSLVPVEKQELGKLTARPGARSLVPPGGPRPAPPPGAPLRGQQSNCRSTNKHGAPDNATRALRGSGLGVLTVPARGHRSRGRQDGPAGWTQPEVGGGSAPLPWLSLHGQDPAPGDHSAVENMVVSPQFLKACAQRRRNPPTLAWDSTVRRVISKGRGAACQRACPQLPWPSEESLVSLPDSVTPAAGAQLPTLRTGRPLLRGPGVEMRGQPGVGPAEGSAQPPPRASPGPCGLRERPPSPLRL